MSPSIPSNPFLTLHRAVPISPAARAFLIWRDPRYVAVTPAQSWIAGRN